MFLSPSSDNALRSIITFILVVALIIGSVFILKYFATEPYSIDTTDFENQILHGGQLDIDGITLTNNRLFGTSVIEVTPDMIVECDSTHGAGIKTFIIEYEGKQFTVQFEVKYRVEFASNGKTLSSQTVSSSSELVAPEITPEPGYEFVGWDFDFTTEELEDNIIINAVFEEVDYPELTDLTAIYGDTLGDVELPSNELGAWEFLKSPDTSVGDAGKNRFGVRFVLTDGTITKSSTVTVNVKKQTLEFTDILDSFTYDGKEHFPTYTLTKDVSVITVGNPQVNAGEYEFTLEIKDKNYEGKYNGVFTIAKPDVTVTVSSATIVYGNAVPEFTYTVEGFDDPTLLGIKIFAPEFASSAGTFEIKATVDNTNVNATVVNGYLVVEKADYTPQPPVFGSATFGDALSTLEFAPVAMGKWVWENPDTIIDKITGIEAWAIFIPENSNNKEVRQLVSITDVKKRELKINVVEDTFVYKEGVEYNVIYIIEDGSYGNIKVVGNDPETDAGTHLKTIAIDDARYTGSVTVDLIIKKADPTVQFGFTLEGVWRPGIQLGDIPLPEGFKWEAPGTVIENAGAAEYTARYDLENLNYNVPVGVINVELERAEGKISGAQTSYNRTYDGNVYTIPGIMANHAESTLVYEYKLGDTIVPEIKNAGVYTVTVTLPETGNYTAASVSFTVTVNRANNLDSVVTTQSATYLDKLSTLLLPTSSIGTWSWKGANEYTTVGNAGTNVFVAVFTPATDNYNTREVEVTVSVAKKTVTVIPTLDSNTLTYTGMPINPDLIGTDPTLYTVTNNGKVNVGNYEVILTLRDPANYKWAENDEATKTLGYSITKADAVISDLAIENWTFGDVAKAPEASTTFGTISYVYSATFGGEYTDTVPTNAGTYYVKAVVAGTSNFNGDTSEPVSFTIAKATVNTVPTLDSTEFTYTGTTLKPTVIGADETLYTVTNEGGTNVGNYTVTLTLADPANYKWAENDEATKTLVYSITKADAVISDLAIENWTFGDVAKAPEASTTFGTVRYVYSKSIDGDYTATVPTLAGTYYVKATVAGTTNYNGAESAPVSFTIAKAAASITGLSATYTTTYTGNPYTVNGINRSHNESDLVFTVNGVTVSSIAVTDAGTYTVVVTLPESANYLEATAEAIITVDAAENTKDVVNANQSATYLDKLSTLTLPESTIGTWSWKDADENTTVGNAGTNKFTAVFTPANGNYLAKEVEVTVSVAKKTVATIPTLNSNSFTYTGEILKPEVIGADETLYTVTNEGGTSVGSYTVTLTLTDPENYKWAENDEATKTLGYSITKADAVISDLAIENWTFGDVAKVPTASTTFGTISYVYSATFAGEYTDTVPTNAGTYYVKAVVAGTSNFNGDTSEPVSFTIAKATVNTVPTLDSTEFTYTGTTVKPAVIGADETLYTVTNEGGINVGNYTVTLTLIDPANYKWAENDEAAKTLGYSITKADAVISDLAIENWTFGDVAKAPEASTTFGTISYVYSTSIDGDYTATVPTLAGTYYVKAVVAGTSNFNGTSETKSFTISKAAASITGLSATYTTIYTGNPYPVTGINRSHNESDLVFTVNGVMVSSIAVTDAGTYTVVVTLPESANYLAATAEAIITVDAAENTKDVVNANQSATYLDKLSTLTLPESTIGTWSWKNADENTTVGNAGTNKFTAVFTPANGNYLAKEVEVTVSVAKKTINLPVVSDKEYTGELITSGLITNDLYTVINDNGGINIGTYSVKVSIVDTANYRWSTTTDTEVIINYQIAAAINSWSVTPEISDITFGDTLVVIGEAKYGDFEVWYKLTGSNDAEYSKTQPTAAGDYTAKFITVDDNYTILTQLVTFKIAKKVVATPTLSANSFTYTGEILKPEVIGADETLYTVTNEGGTSVGSYTVTLTLTDPANYKWAENDEATKTLGYSITKADAVISDLAIENWTFGESAKAPEASTTFGTISYVYSATFAGEYTDTVPTNAGTYYVKAVVAGTSNFNGDTSEPVSFTIAKATVNTVPTLDSTEFTYTGEILKPEVIGADETLYTVTNEGGINVGNYTVTLTLTDPANYKWAENDEATKTLGYSITMADAVISDLAIENWTFGESAKAPEASTTFGTISYVYSTSIDGEYTATVPTLAGTYYVKATVAGTTNYSGAETTPVSFTISKAAASITGLSATYTTIYTGNPYTVNGINRSHNESDLVFTVNGVTVSSIAVTDAGTYTVVVTLPESANYLEATAEAIITVDAAENTKDVVNANQSATYLDKLSTLTLPESTIGTWSWKNADENTTVGNAGTNKFTAVFTPANGNYLAKEVEVTVSVAKKTVATIPTLNSNSFTYTGEILKPEVIGADETLYTVTNEGGTSVGSYTVTLTLTDPANYKWAENDEATKTLGYSITKADAVISDLAIENWTFGESAKAPTASTNVGSIVFVYSSTYAGTYTTTVPTNAGTYYVKARVEGTANYNGAESAEPVSFTIAKAEITAPTLNSYEIPYTGSTVKPTLIGADETLCTITNNGGLNVGDECKVVIRINDTVNYKWADTDEAEIEIAYSIVKADVVISEFAIQGWTYGESAKAPSATTNLGTVSFEYSTSETGTYSTTVPSAAGTYYVKAKVAESANYNGAEKIISFTISKAAASITGLSATYTTTYTGNPYTVTGINRSHNESALAFTINGVTVSSIAVTDAGTYTVVVTLPESANYLAATAEATITVNAAENTKDVVNTNQSATYLDKLSTLALPTSTIGTWSWKNADANTTVGNAGANKFTAVFTPANGNYLAKEVEVTVNVAQIAITSIPSITQNSFSYTGSEIKPTLNGVDTTLCEVVYPGSVNAGDYVVTVKIKDAVNYKWVGGDSTPKTYAYSITKGAPNITQFSIPTTEYGADIVPNITVDFGTVRYVYSTSENGTYSATVPTEIGTYYAKAIIDATDNYSGTEAGPVSFSITKATPTVTFTPTTPSTGGQYYQNLLDFNNDTVATNKKGVTVTGTVSNLTVTFNGASSSYSFTFNPADTTHYNSVPVSGSINLKTVATIGFNGTAFGTIEDALTSAVSGNTVWVKADASGNVYITTNITVKSGVTLLLPYGDANSAEGRNQSATSTLAINTETKLYMTSANEHVADYRKTLVKLAEGVQLTVAGTLEIAGELTGGGGGNMAGHTAGRYAELMLEKDAKITVAGTALVYGYITNSEEGDDRGTLVTVNDGATLKQPFTLIDFRGGSILKAVNDNIKDKKNHPFCQFKFMNVSVETRYEFGSKLNVWANLDTGKLIGEGSQHNFREVTFIGAGGIIELTNSNYSYLLAKFDPDTQITDVRIYGGAKTNTMSLTVSAGLTSVTVSSADYYFGISWLYNITLDNAPNQSTTAQFTMGYTSGSTADYYYKLMPGSKLTVEEGAILSVGYMTIYDTFNDPIYNTDNGSKTCPYPTVYPDTCGSLSGQSIPHAQLIVKGGVVANYLAGDVYAGANGATVIVNKGTTITTNELENHSGNSLTASAGSYVQITKNLKLIYDNEVTEITLGETYMTINGLWVIGVDYITLEIPEGVAYTAEQTVTLDANGIPSKAGATTGTGGTLHIVRGSKLTLNLGAGQIAADDPSILEINGIDAFNALANASSALELNPMSSGKLDIYTIPLFELEGSELTDCTVKYYNIDKPDEMTAEIVFTKVLTSDKDTIEISISVSGVDTSKLSALQGTLSGSKCKATGSKTTVTAQVKVTLGNADFAGITKISATGSVDKDESCITPDSLITLADGTQVRVDSLTGDEMLLVWNLETGKFDYAPIMFVDSDAEEAFEVIYLHFSDGTVVKVISEHGFWDYDLNRYVYLDRNAAEYIGHYFAKQSGDELAKVQLVDVEIKTEITTAWSPVTVGHLCYFVNGMLTMPGGVGGLFNIFEVDAETMTYDYEAMERDIETYGLFTYEEMNAICPLSEEMFYAAGGQYLKISIGKGNLTIDELIYMIERYSVYV